MSLAILVKELRERTGAGILDCKKALGETNNDMDAAADWLRENGIAKAAKKGDRVASEGLTKITVSGNKAVVFELNSETDFVAKNEQFLEMLNTIGEALVNSGVSTVEEALALSLEDGTIDSYITNGTATIGEKISLRRFSIIEKSDSQQFASYSHMGGRISVLLLIEGEQEIATQVCMHVAAIAPRYLSEAQVDPAVVAEETEMLTKEALAEGKPANIVENMVKGRIKKFLKEICLLDQDFVVDSDKSVRQALEANNTTIISMARLEVGEGIVKEEVDFAAEVAAQLK